MAARARSIRKRASAAFFGVVFALVLVEAGYRIVRSSGLSPTTNPAYVVHDPTLGWSYRPDSRARHTTGEFDVAITINSSGFRGRDWPPTATSAPKAKPRVLVLGDSFAFGWGVEDERCFCAVLQKSEPGWDVFNAGVSGYGTDQEELLLERLLPVVQPDVVVCQFCGNDLFECASSVVYGKHKPWFERAGEALVLRGVPVAQSRLESWSQLWCAIEKARFEDSHMTRHADPGREWPLVCDILRRMNSKLGGIPLVILSSEDRLAAFASGESGVVHVDARRAFAGVAGPVEFPLDGHWTPLGHERIGTALDTTLRSILR